MTATVHAPRSACSAPRCWRWRSAPAPACPSCRRAKRCRPRSAWTTRRWRASPPIPRRRASSPSPACACCPAATRRWTRAWRWHATPSARWTCSTTCWPTTAPGRQLLRALRDASLRGVRVRLLLDDLHSADVAPLLAALAAHEGVEVRLFNPLPLRVGSPMTRLLLGPGSFEQMHRRMHNKLFIADGQVAITGGRNIGDEYFMKSSAANFVDMDILCTGAALPELRQVFERYWHSAHAVPLQQLQPVRHGRVAAARGPGRTERTRPARPERGRPPARRRPPGAGVRPRAGAGRCAGQGAALARARRQRARPGAGAAAQRALGSGDRLALLHPRRARHGHAARGHRRQACASACSPIRWPRPTSRWCTRPMRATAWRCSTWA